MQKPYPITSFKAVQPGLGIFEATVSVFGNVDLIGDRVVKGAFTKSLQNWNRSGDPIPVIWSHEWDNPDAHIGKVLTAVESSEGLVISGQLDLDNPFAAQVYRLLKERRVKEMSFAYDVVKEKRASDGANDLLEVNIIEVGPTLKGMNPATQLIGVKKAIASHSTDTSDATWDGPANKTNLPNEDGEAAYRKAFAWYDAGAADPNGDGYPDNKGDWKFIHHFVSSDGSVGAASTVACSTGIGVLNGGRTGTTIPDADRQGVWAHLAKHLTDSGTEAPELKSFEESETKAEEPLPQTSDAILAHLVADLPDGHAQSRAALEKLPAGFLSNTHTRLHDSGTPEHTHPGMKSSEFDDSDLQELIGHLVKAGRTISKANENKIQAAIVALQEVLASIEQESVEKAGSPGVHAVEDELLQFRLEIDSMRARKGA